ncbi:hypothetical protein VSR68_30640 [Paraburkholderia phymatum]|uniref:hypothetical protein n=1 Tax=Paraburkholderia phymatum TaxID=148447 RepID=UPI00317C5C9B
MISAMDPLDLVQANAITALRRQQVEDSLNFADNQVMKTELNDNADTMDAVLCIFGHTPETVAGKAAQINVALAAGDHVTAAAVVFDHARDCRVPPTEHDPRADEVMPYPDLAPFGNQGLQQFMEALGRLGMRIVVEPMQK